MSLADWLLIALLAAVIAILAFIGWKYPDKRSAEQRMEDDPW